MFSLRNLFSLFRRRPRRNRSANDSLVLSERDGKRYTLDFRTGAVKRSNLSRPKTQLAPASAITPAWIAEAARAAGYEPVVHEDGAVTMDSPTGMLYLHTEGTQLLRLVHLRPLAGLASQDAIHAFASRMNDRTDIARFYMTTPESLVADHVLPIAHGLTAQTLGWALRQFDTEVLLAQRLLDEEGVLDS